MPRPFRLRLGLVAASMIVRGAVVHAEPRPTTPTRATRSRASWPRPVIDLDALCDPAPKPVPIVSCVLLTEVPLARLGAARCARCAATGAPCDPAIDWSGLRSDWWDYLRNCVYAAHGKPFRKREWRAAFRPAAGGGGYRPRADFRAAELSPIERANVEDLKRRAERSPIVLVSAADLARVRAWFREARAGRARLPARLTDQAEPTTADHVRGWIANREPLTSATAVVYSEGDAASRRRTIVFGDSPGPDCQVDDEICEGGFGVALTYEGTRLVAVDLFGAACPHVFVESADGARSPQGEILRNLRHRALEATQGLALEAGASCRPVLRVVLAETKPEITHLDAAWIEIDGERIDPAACTDRGSPCADDGRYAEVATGEERALDFAIPPALRCRPATLRANGFYVPLAASR
jgi:hypothetical protein